ncbi:MAG: GNAT family N-acetyltransferase [Actinomycetota bacterium]|nr:GNAT family N-acetyltransferase [Actinomycetota bacterium]
MATNHSSSSIAGPEPASGEIAIRSIRSITDIDAADWDALVDERGMYQSYRWLLLREDDVGGRVSYLLADRAGKLVGAVALYGPPPGRHAEGQADTIRVGTIVGHRNRLLVRPGTGEAEQLTVLTALVGGARGVAAAQGYESLVFEYLTSSDVQRLGSAVPVTATFAGSEFEIVTNGRSLGTYLGRLSASMRSQVRREMRRFTSAGWRGETESASAVYRQAVPLLIATEAKYGRVFGDADVSQFLRQYAERMDDSGVAFTCRDGDRLVGLSLLFRWKSALYARVVGFDYGALRGSFEYFNLLFYRPIAYMHEHGLDTLHLGIQGGWDAKVRRGATAAPLWSCVVPASGEGGRVDWQDLATAQEFAHEVQAVAPAAIHQDEWQPVTPGAPRR